MKDSRCDNIISRKIRSERGESIAEVLIAVLVVAFAAIILVSMVMAARNIIEKSEEMYKEEMAEHNSMEMITGDKSGYASYLNKDYFDGEQEITITEDKNGTITIKGASGDNPVEVDEIEQKVTDYEGSYYYAFRYNAE